MKNPTETVTVFLDVANEYLDYALVSTTPGHVRWVKCRLSKYFRHLFEVPVHAMTACFVRRQLADWDKICSRKTVNRNLEVWKMIFSFAESQGLIEANPIRRVRPLPEAHRPPYVPSTEDIEKVRASLGPTVKDLLDIACRTGLRKMQLLRIRWSDVDFKGRKITVYTRKTKSRSLTPRTVPITDQMASVLLKLKDQAQNGWVFTGSDGEPYQRLGMTLPYACDRAGVRRWNWHSLRHRAAHVLAERGASPSQIQRQLGHELLSTTDRYLRSLEDADLSTARLLDDPLEET